MIGTVDGKLPGVWAPLNLMAPPHQPYTDYLLDEKKRKPVLFRPIFRSAECSF